MWDLIVSVPDHCLSFYFADADLDTTVTHHFNKAELKQKLNFLASNVERGSPGLPLRSL